MFSTLSRRVAAPRRRFSMAAAATLVFLAACMGGCRDGDGPTDNSTPLQSFRVAEGEMFRYARWDLDPSGYIDANSRKDVLWQVVETEATLFGRRGVIVVTDSIMGSPVRADSLLLHIGEEDGDLYAYGFLAAAMRRKTDARIPPAWDKIIAFGEGVNRPWTVGTSDSAGEKMVNGVVTEESRYFAATVNGTSMMFQGRCVLLSGTDLSIELWISDQPSALPKIVEEPMYPSSYGLLSELTEVLGVVP